MNVAQNISAIVNSPELAAVALQAVQAGEMAERQGLAALRREHLQKEIQVAGSEAALNLEGVDQRPLGTFTPPPRRRAARKTQAPLQAADEADGPSVGDGHRINLVA